MTFSPISQCLETDTHMVQFTMVIQVFWLFYLLSLSRPHTYDVISIDDAIGVIYIYVML